MPRFFVDELLPTTVMTGPDALHIARSLRMSAGESITLCDGRGLEAEGVIASLSPDAVTVRVGESEPSKSEPSVALTLYLAMPKGDKTEWVIQKAVELGAKEVVLVLTERCVARPKGPDALKKISRYKKIALEAAMQSGRGMVPDVRGIISFENALQEMKTFDHTYILYEGECPSLRGQLPSDAFGRRIALMTGSEGGFSSWEIDAARRAGIGAASLGPRVLRCETAALTALSVVLFALGQME